MTTICSLRKSHHKDKSVTKWSQSATTRNVVFELSDHNNVVTNNDHNSVVTDNDHNSVVIDNDQGQKIVEIGRFFGEKSDIGGPGKEFAVEKSNGKNRTKIGINRRFFTDFSETGRFFQLCRAVLCTRGGGASGPILSPIYRR